MNTQAGEILKKAREKRRWTQAQVAKKIEISSRQYQKYEDGEFPLFKGKKIKELDTLLNTNLYELIYEQKNQIKAPEKQEDAENATEPVSKDEHITLQKKHIELQSKSIKQLENTLAEKEEIKKMEERILDLLGEIKTNLSTLSQDIQGLHRPVGQVDHPVKQTLPWGKRNSKNPSKDNPNKK